VRALIRQIADHENLCTWHTNGERCGQPAVIGSLRTALCWDHMTRLTENAEPNAADLDEPEASSGPLHHHTSHPRIVIPFAENGLADEVRELGESLDAKFVLTPRNDTEAYFRLMARLWSEGEAFMIIEADVLPTVETVHEMWNCPEEWCHGYWEEGGIKHSQWLGCARFSDSLLRRAPDIMEKTVGEWARHWAQQDLALDLALRAIRDGRGPHLHHPAVTHLHHEMEQRRAAAGLPADTK